MEKTNAENNTAEKDQKLKREARLERIVMKGGGRLSYIFLNMRTVYIGSTYIGVQYIGSIYWMCFHVILQGQRQLFSHRHTTHIHWYRIKEIKGG